MIHRLIFGMALAAGAAFIAYRLGYSDGFDTGRANF
jgi:hypothetical protein